jgi:hypothetical protein
MISPTKIPKIYLYKNDTITDVSMENSASVIRVELTGREVTVDIFLQYPVSLLLSFNG